jgi:MYXO-CTERM domain-containing protein
VVCSSYELRPDGPPVQVANLKRLTALNNGERTCNHPKAAADENGNIVWMYGSDTNSNRPNTWAGIVNSTCDQVAAPIMVNAPRNANDGAADIQYLGNGHFIGGYYSDGGDTATAPFPAEGGRYSVAMGLTLSSGAVLPTLNRDWIQAIITPTDIGRPTIAPVDQTHGLFCAGKGPNRPSDSIECALVDATNGNVLTKNEFFSGTENGMNGMRSYFNQPTVVKVSDTQYALMAVESNGMGKNSNIKGANLNHLVMIERNGDTLIRGAQLDGAGQHQTHATICQGGYGEQGAPALGVFSGPPTGIGRGAMGMVQFDPGLKTLKYDANADLWPAAWYADSGHLSNWYGRNPMRQGRDFLRCVGNVDNPGYHQANGYMADVKTFFAAAVHGRVPGDEKNSLFLSLIPGWMDKKATPQNPVPAGEVPDTSQNNDNTNANTPKASSGCGCSTPGTSNTNGMAALAGLALGLGIVVSRRRRTA